MRPLLGHLFHGLATYRGTWSLTCRMLCAYSIGAPIGAGQTFREKHHHPLPITSCFPANNWDFYKETTYCGVHTTIIYLSARDPYWSVFRSKKGISPDRYNTKPWNCTLKLGGLYWFFPPKKFEAITSPQVGVQFLMSNECRDTFFRSMTLMLGLN